MTMFLITRNKGPEGKQCQISSEAADKPLMKTDINVWMRFDTGISAHLHKMFTPSHSPSFSCPHL